MQVGLIAEGPADLAVLTNIVIGVLGIEREQITHIRPQLTQDQTDLNKPGEQQFSNWEWVKRECEARGKIEEFLNSPIVFEGEDDRRIVVVQIDAAECHLPHFDVVRPDRKLPDYAQILLKRVNEKMESWMGGILPNVIKAVAVEETDAWILALYIDKDTCRIGNPKKEMERIASKEKLPKGRTMFETYLQWSKDLRKSKKRKEAEERNYSFKILVQSLEDYLQSDTE